MTSTSESPVLGKLIHVGRIFTTNGQWLSVFLRKHGEGHFVWHEEQNDNKETPTSVEGQTVEEALRLAPKHWRNHFFRMLNCGFRYTLPERDEHGINALFHQMAASYSSMNGIYYDEELGNNCFVQNASEEALDLWRQLKKVPGKIP